MFFLLFLCIDAKRLIIFDGIHFFQPEPTRYHLRLDGSKNVNLDVDKNMIIDKTVSPNVHEILLVGIAVDCSRDWFISVRRASKVSTTSQMTPISA